MRLAGHRNRGNRTARPAQLLQPPKPWTDELDDPKLKPPPPVPKPEKAPLWVPKPEVCWDREPKVGAFWLARVPKDVVLLLLPNLVW